MQKIQVWFLSQEAPPEKGMATHSSILPGEAHRQEEPGGLQFTGPQRIRHDWVTNTHTCWVQGPEKQNRWYKFQSRSENLESQWCEFHSESKSEVRRKPINVPGRGRQLSRKVFLFVCLFTKLSLTVLSHGRSPLGSLSIGFPGRFFTAEPPGKPWAKEGEIILSFSAFYFIQAISWLDETHSQRQSALLGLPIQVLILSKALLTHTPRNSISPSIWEFSGIVKLTHKINHYTFLVFYRFV